MGDYWTGFTSAAFFLDEGDSVKGFIERLDFADLREGRVPKLWVRKDDGSLVTVIATQKHLLAELVRLRPVVGDRIGIQLSGETKAAPGMSPTKMFVVWVKHPGAPGPAVSPALELPPLAEAAGVDLTTAMERVFGRPRTLGGLSADELDLLRAHLQSLVLAARKMAAESPRP
jgi:hypothetical protein